jgi:two-component system, cell cycle response regulator DivK
VAIEWAEQYRPDLILMDLQLPDLSGLEATRRLKANEETSSIPVIAVTAFAMAGDERRALEHGCDAYVTKPIVLRDFLNLIVDFIGEAPGAGPARCDNSPLSGVGLSTAADSRSGVRDRWCRHERSDAG